jgi:arsenite-transporting ATPase
METPTFLGDRSLQLLLFGGKGGVGKTTCATAAALALAERFSDASYLLVSIDPAHSLADCLGGILLPDNLTTLELDSQECLSRFKAKHHRELHEIVSRGTFLDEQDIRQFLELSLPGLDELMAFLEISQWVKKRDYDCIIVDTAPTGHCIHLLTMPQLMQQWLSALDALLAKHRYIKTRFNPSAPDDETDRFLEELAASVEEMETLLRDPARCRFVPVLLAEALIVHETHALLRELESLQVAVRDIVVNRLLTPTPSCRVCMDTHWRQQRELGNLFAVLPAHTFWGVPLYPEEVRGRKALEMFWKTAQELDPIVPNFFCPAEGLPVRVEGNAGLPWPEKSLLIFAGKGGVGKTTLACATAARWASECPDQKILLFSLDPAHSLSACLTVPVGATPTRMDSGWSAMQIDAQAEFETLKQQYQEELSEFLDSLLPNVDLTYDREVMERILDLAPPGLDELMALLRIMEFIERDQYEVLILDSAPTGHLIRFLELPELIEQWLRVFFGLFLKYKKTFRLPKISQRLVEMSKRIKQLRALLHDSQKSALYAVSILTEMALEETKDLLQACQRMSISAPVLFLNQATPAGECPLCSALCWHEQEIRGKFREAFPELQQIVVYKQGDPRGLKDLERLGRALYETVATRNCLPV